MQTLTDVNIDVQTTTDHTIPDGKWQFDEGVTHVFDDMLSRSIPLYEVMREACFQVGSRFVQPKTAIVDLGCSRGEALKMLLDRFGANNRFVGVETSDPMLDAAKERFEGYIRCGVVDIRKMDLRTEYPPERASVTLAVLTLQFVPIEYRQRVIADVYRHTVEGGALIVVEKVLGSTADIDGTLVENYLSMKREHGYSEEEIQRKRLSLEGVLVPVTAKWNEEMLFAAGFRQVDCFWRWMNFAAWVAVK